MSKGYFRHFSKALQILFLPRHHWRISLFLTRRKLTKLEDPKAIPSPVARQLDYLEKQSFRHPAALHPTYLVMRWVGQEDRAIRITERIFEAEGANSVEFSLACARVWFERREFGPGDAAIAAAKKADPDFVAVYQEEAHVQGKRGNSNVAVEAASHVLRYTNDPNQRAKWLRFLGKHYFLLRDYKAAASAIGEGLNGTTEAKTLYRLAYSLEQLGEYLESEEHYQRAGEIQCSEYPRNARTAALHFKYQRYEEALSALPTENDELPVLKLRVAILLQLAQYSQITVATEDETDPYLLECRALAFEFLGADKEAIKAYSKLLLADLSGERRKLLLERRQRAAHKLRDFSVSLESGQIMAGPLIASTHWHKEVDPKFEETVHETGLEKLISPSSASLTTYRKLYLSSSSQWNYQRAVALLATGKAKNEDLEEASKYYFLLNNGRMPHLQETSRRFSKLTHREHYSELYETVPLEGDVILYESFHGSKTSCNPLAICRRLLDGPEGKELQHVWAIKDDAEIHPSLLGRPNVHFVRHGSFGYRMRLATAKYLVNNVTFPQYYVRREGQHYLNTWHGVPWKHLGKDFADDSYSFYNIAKNLLQSTALALPDEHTASKLIQTQDVSKLLAISPSIVGSARVDYTFSLDEISKEQILDRLGASKVRPVVFYAPTWRGTGGNPEADTVPFAEAISELSRLNADIVVRLHHMMQAQLDHVAFPENVLIADPTVDTNEILGVTDVLVSDYSSLIFDFAPLNRPIIKYVFDLKEYESERGLYFAVDQVPGESCETINDLLMLVSEGIKHKVADWSTSSLSHVWKHEDGLAADRSIELLFNPPVPDETARPKVNLIATGGLNPNGITRSLRNIVGTYSASDNVLQLVIPRTPLLNANVADTAKELHSRVDFSLLTGIQTGTRQEKITWDRLVEGKTSLSEDARKHLGSLMLRERYRHFGTSKINAVVDFESYTLTNLALFAFGFPEISKRVSVLHSEFYREMLVRFPRLRSMGMLLKEFTTVTSVSSAVLENNRTDLSREFGVLKERVVLLPNTLNLDEILEMADAPLDDDLARWFSEPGPHIIAVGRLSVEKNPVLAIEALALAHKRGKQAKLVFVGDGPLLRTAQMRVSELGLEASVFFAGQLSNPYSAIRTADALIMTSLHEGQPMVLLEALTLGTKVFTTDIPGTRSVLEDGKYGLLVESTVEGVCSGYEAVIADTLPSSHFDANSYQETALGAFGDLVADGSSRQRAAKNREAEDGTFYFGLHEDLSDVLERLDNSREPIKFLECEHEKPEQWTSLIHLARRQDDAYKLLIALAQRGFLIYRAPSQGSLLVHRSSVRDVWPALSEGQYTATEDGTVYSFSPPRHEGPTTALVVVFSSVAKNAYSQLLDRYFPAMLPRLEESVSGHTAVLRIADLDGVIGGYYLPTSRDPESARKVQHLIFEIADSLGVKRDKIVLYGPSKGGTGALYNAIKMGVNSVSIDPTTTTVGREERQVDPFFMNSAIYPESLQETIERAILESGPYSKKAKPPKHILITAPESREYFRLNEFVRKYDDSGFSIIESLDPHIEAHRDVSPNTVSTTLALLNFMAQGLPITLPQKSTIY